MTDQRIAVKIKIFVSALKGFFCDFLPLRVAWKF